MDIKELKSIYTKQSQSNAKSDIKETLKEYTRYIQISIRSVHDTKKIIATVYTLDGDTLVKKQDGALIEFNKLVNGDTVDTDYYSYNNDIKTLLETLKTETEKTETR